MQPDVCLSGTWRTLTSALPILVDSRLIIIQSAPNPFRKCPMPLSVLSDHTDFLTPKGAEAVCSHIREYWQERGHSNVNAWVVKRPGAENEWDVRSNLLNGLPRAPKAVRA